VPLDLPNLDDVTWQQLAEQGRTLIPGWAPEWTNHNAADPGITLVELFAYFSEILIYRLNRISTANLRAFLQLIRGPEWSAPEDLDQAKRETLRDLCRTSRAVTAGDFERLALATGDAVDGRGEKVARAKAVFGRNLACDDRAAALSEAPGHVSVIVVPSSEGGRKEPGAGLLRRVRRALEPARLLTTRVHVEKPHYVSFGVRLTLVIPTTAGAEQVRERAIQALEKLFDPLEGGAQGQGWPFGCSVYVSEVYELLAKVPGVKTVQRSIDPQTRLPLEELMVPAPEAGRRRLNQDGRLKAIHLDPDELVLAELRERDIAVVTEQ
jgi:hypothetical protein